MLEDKPVDVDVWINDESELGKIPDRRGEFVAPSGMTVKVGDKYRLVLSEGDSRHIVVISCSGDHVSFVETPSP